ncbi:MAG: NAD(P)/FAD-dependent oxidoreductase [Piscinibacter sp.]|uniref:NAD(P)/FAD-dependent oxidoreductase n=1 Tax=Piscinibacter sp. TaxID=1903157 RepID=UPI003D12FD25
MRASNPSKRVAVVGAGLAGSAAARRLADAGHDVQVFDKARGAGGRLATRRAEWIDRQDAPRTTRLDHGAPGFGARDDRFRAFVAEAVGAGWLTPWTPVWSSAGLGVDERAELFVAVPEMPRLCRELLAGIDCGWNEPVEGLLRGGARWRLRRRGVVLPDEYDIVVLAMPPVQAAPLLIPHAPGWARTAARVAMRPCWTLMGISEPTRAPPGWQAARPPQGPLDWLIRNETKPGRERRDDEIHWVVHARADWSAERLEAPGEQVQDELEAAVDDWLGESLRWKHALVHRWRYALPPVEAVEPGHLHWWDRLQGLGVCGDFLGGSGVEGAWLSGATLADAVLASGTGARGRGRASGADAAAEAA